MPSLNTVAECLDAHRSLSSQLCWPIRVQAFARHGQQGPTAQHIYLARVPGLCANRSGGGLGSVARSAKVVSGQFIYQKADDVHAK